MTGSDAPPPVSVVVSTADRCSLAVDCLGHLRRQSYPGSRYEVIVVDDGSRDATPTTIPRLGRYASEPTVRYVREAGRGPAAARNAGLAAARGELVCFLDDDALAPEGWLAAVVAGAARHPSARGFGGPVRPRFEHPPPPTCGEHDLAGARLDHGPADLDVEEVWGCNMAIRASAPDLAGTFDECIGIAEDWDWGRRLREAGGRIVYLADAWVWHRRLRSDLRLAALLVEYYRRGYVVACRDDAQAAGASLRGTLASLRHAASERCTRGLTDAARSLGLWSGARAPRSRRPGQPRRCR